MEVHSFELGFNLTHPLFVGGFGHGRVAGGVWQRWRPPQLWDPRLLGRGCQLGFVSGGASGPLFLHSWWQHLGHGEYRLSFLISQSCHMSSGDGCDSLVN